MLVLGIETSCDETSAAVVKDGVEILSNVVSSQVALHAKFGGVVPEVASRKQVELMNPVLEEALVESGVRFGDLAGVAVTNGPGLLGSLLVGVCAAKVISYVFNIALVGVNHLEGHIYANFLVNPEIKLPVVCLIASGGHTELVLMERHGMYSVLGKTRDDAAGEAFDKVARVVGLGYPGGPIIDELAKEGNPEAIEFPRALIRGDDFDFSFSGLKTAVVRYVGKHQVDVRDVVASFQKAVVDILVEKTIRAAGYSGVKTILLGGGVSNNSLLRGELGQRAIEEGLTLYCPPAVLCTDNAAMVACAGCYKLKNGRRDGLDLETVANLKLGDVT